MVGFFLLLLVIGGGLILWRYGWGGLIGGLACILAFLGVLGLIWLFLGLAGRWAEDE
jgi:hypothetical protein